MQANVIDILKLKFSFYHYESLNGIRYNGKIKFLSVIKNFKNQNLNKFINMG